jgi:N-acetylmuramoyl-L-alanine amidase
MRKIDYIVLHCTATPQTTKIESIINYWRNHLGWRNPGYHYIIEPNGRIVNLLPISSVSNGVAGYNSNSIHISYIGGIDSKGQGFDNRTAAQKEAQLLLLYLLKCVFPKAMVQGHRDFPKVAKACPSFDTRGWLSSIGRDDLLVT